MDFQKLFNPQSVAVIGASANRKKLGWQILNNIIEGGFKGNIYPINLKEKEILGKKVFRSIGSIRNKIDLAVIAIPAQFVINEIIACGKIGIKNLIVITAGFSEDSESGAKLEDEMKKIASKYKLNIIGPNCLGIIDSSAKLNATFAKTGVRDGHVAFLSQSGAICSAVLDWAKEKNIGFSKFVSLGNKVVVDENDLLDFLAKDKKTDLVVLYLEEISQGQKFMEVISRLSRVKPVAVMYGGRSKAGSQAAQSHTGSMAGSYQAIKTAMARSGAIELCNLEEMFNLIIFYSRPFKVSNNKVFIISNAGGPLVSTVDVLSDHDLVLGELDKATKDKLAKELPPIIKIKNPLDLIGDADAQRYEIAIKYFLEDKNVSNLLVLLTPQTSTEITKTSKVVSDYSHKYPNKFIATSFIGGESLIKAVNILEDNKVPNFLYPNQAIQFLSKFINYNLNRPRLPYKANRANKFKTKESRQLDYIESFNLIAKAGIKTLTPKKLSTSDGYSTLKYPVAIKIVSENIIHKTEKNSVSLNIKDQNEAKKVVNSLSKCKDKKAYCVAQPMGKGIELILGFKRDESFGPVVMVGAGGIYAEIMKDYALEISDLDINRAYAMINKLKINEILKGARGHKAYAINALAQTILNIAKFANDNPEIRELDINPLFINDKDVVAADIRIIV